LISHNVYPEFEKGIEPGLYISNHESINDILSRESYKEIVLNQNANHREKSWFH
jgi:hypothetical protein